MFKRIRMCSSANHSPKTAFAGEVREKAAVQSEIRRIRRSPIKDEATLRRLCALLLLDKDNIAVVELDKRRRVTHITSVPLCFRHALEDYGYLHAVLGKREYCYRAVAVHLRAVDEDTVEDTAEILERFRLIANCKRTVYVMCRGFDTETV